MSEVDEVEVYAEGRAEPVPADDHETHSIVYLPDLSSETGWAAHRVPEREPERRDRRPVGFRPRTR